MFDKAVEFARNGKGRRLLNTLHRKDCVLTRSELEEILKIYQETGLPKEVETLKKRRGLLAEVQYDMLAQKVLNCCSAEHFENFSDSLRKLLSSGMTMNPLKTDIESLTEPKR